MCKCCGNKYSTMYRSHSLGDVWCYTCKNGDCHGCWKDKQPDLEAFKPDNLDIVLSELAHRSKG